MKACKKSHNHNNKTVITSTKYPHKTKMSSKKDEEPREIKTKK